MSLRKRALAPLGVGLVGLFLLTGCAPEIPAAELPAYTVLLQKERDENRKRDFTYIDGSGEQRATECSRDGIFSRTVCESEDGVLSFSYTVDEDGYVHVRKITVDGSFERKMSRVRTDIEGIRRAWAPSDSIPEDKE